MVYDCVIIGGGIAGLQAAIQLGRYRHKTAILDAGEGRAAKCRCYHNLIGWPDGVSGEQLLAHGRRQVERLGVHLFKETAVQLEKVEDGFRVSTDLFTNLLAKRLLLATGVKDRLPDFQELIPCMGISVFICPDCDGYEIADRQVVVLGAGLAGANMALALTHWSDDIIYINHELSELEDRTRRQLTQQGIVYVEQSARKVLVEGSQFKGIILNDGAHIECEHCFIAFGSNKVRSELAEQLELKLLPNKHIWVDPRTKMSSVEHVWAAGDVTPHSELLTAAMGDGSQAAIWIHKSLITTS